MNSTNSDSYKSIDIRKNPILRYCEEPKSIEQIRKKLNMKRSTLVYYLKALEKKGVITWERIEKDMTGRPSLIKTNTKKINELQTSSSYAIGRFKPIKYEILLILQWKKKPLSKEEIENILHNKYGNMMKPPAYMNIKQEDWDKLDGSDRHEFIIDMEMDVENFLNHPFTFFEKSVGVLFHLTKEGKQYLQKYKSDFNRVSQGKYSKKRLLELDALEQIE